MARFSMFAAGLAMFGVGLAGCSEQETEPTAEQAADGVPGVTVENARLVLPPVSGNPAVAYFDLTYDGERAVMLRRADVEGAESAQLHEMVEVAGVMEMGESVPLRINTGETISYAPGGRHVMVFGPPSNWQAGDTAQVTLTFLGGDTVTFPATIQAADEDR